MPRNQKRIFWLGASKSLDERAIDALRKNGHKISVITSRTEVIEKSRPPDYFSLLITDLMIYPQKGNLCYNGIHWHETGLEFLRRLRASSLESYGLAKDIPVIVLTRVIAEGAITACRRDPGVIAYLDKWGSYPVLLEAVTQALSPVNPVQIAN